MLKTFLAVLHLLAAGLILAAAPLPNVTITGAGYTECSGDYDPFGAGLSCVVKDYTTGAILDYGSRDAGVLHPNYRFTWSYVPVYGSRIRIEVRATDNDGSVVTFTDYP